jgi:hypothetical protein
MHAVPCALAAPAPVLGAGSPSARADGTMRHTCAMHRAYWRCWHVDHMGLYLYAPPLGFLRTKAPGPGLAKLIPPQKCILSPQPTGQVVVVLLDSPCGCRDNRKNTTRGFTKETTLDSFVKKLRAVSSASALLSSMRTSRSARRYLRKL